VKGFPVAFANFDFGVKELDVLLDGGKVAEHHFKLRLVLGLIKDSRIEDSSVNVHYELTLRDVLVSD
jgi:hypothetical protein